MWNCDTGIYQRHLNFQVCLNLQVRFALFLVYPIEVDQILYWSKNSGYSLNQPSYISVSQWPKSITVLCLSLRRQILRSISQIVKALRDHLRNIEMMYPIMKRRFSIPCVPNQYRWVFPCWVMKSRSSSTVSPVELDGFGFGTTRRFYSIAHFDKPRQIIIIWSHSRHPSEPCLSTSHYLEQFIWLHSNHILFLPGCSEYMTASMHWVSYFRH